MAIELTGDILRILRRSCNISQRDFAELLEISPQTYNQMENLHKTLSFNLITKIADIFDVRPSIILTAMENIELTIDYQKEFARHCFNFVLGEGEGEIPNNSTALQLD